MTRRSHDDQSPVFEYLKPSHSPRPDAPGPGLPTTAGVLTPTLAQRPEVHEFIEYIQTGDPGELALALVDGRAEHLAHRQQMINFVRRFVALPPRGVAAHKKIADVTRQLEKLYEQASAMLRAKNALADEMIVLATKRGKLELERATYEAKIATQRRLKAEEEAQTRQAQATGGKGARVSIDMLIAKTAARAKEQFPKGSLERATWARVEELALSGATLADLFATVAPEQHEAVKEKLRAAGIRVD